MRSPLPPSITTLFTSDITESFVLKISRDGRSTYPVLLTPTSQFKHGKRAEAPITQINRLQRRQVTQLTNRIVGEAAISKLDRPQFRALHHSELSIGRRYLQLLSKGLLIDKERFERGEAIQDELADIHAVEGAEGDRLQLRELRKLEELEPIAEVAFRE